MVVIFTPNLKNPSIYIVQTHKNTGGVKSDGEKISGHDDDKERVLYIINYTLSEVQLTLIVTWVISLH